MSIDLYVSYILLYGMVSSLKNRICIREHQIEDFDGSGKTELSHSSSIWGGAGFVRVSVTYFSSRVMNSTNSFSVEGKRAVPVRGALKRHHAQGTTQDTAQSSWVHIKWHSYTLAGTSNSSRERLLPEGVRSIIDAREELEVAEELETLQDHALFSNGTTI